MYIFLALWGGQIGAWGFHALIFTMMFLSFATYQYTPMVSQMTILYDSLVFLGIEGSLASITLIFGHEFVYFYLPEYQDMPISVEHIFGGREEITESAEPESKFEPRKEDKEDSDPVENKEEIQTDEETIDGKNDQEDVTEEFVDEEAPEDRAIFDDIDEEGLDKEGGENDESEITIENEILIDKSVIAKI